LASGKLPCHTKGAGTRITIFKLNGHGSLGRYPHLLFKTSKRFMPNNDAILAWGKRGLWGSPGRRPTPKGVISTHQKSRDLPAFPEYQAKGKKLMTKKTSNSWWRCKRGYYPWSAVRRVCELQLVMAPRHIGGHTAAKRIHRLLPGLLHSGSNLSWQV